MENANRMLSVRESNSSICSFVPYYTNTLLF